MLRSLPARLYNTGRFLDLIDIIEAYGGFLIDYEDIAVLDTFLKELNIYLKNNHCLYLFSDPYFEYQKHDVDGKPYGDKADAVLKTFIENGWRHHGFGSGESNDYEPRWMSAININARTKEEVFNSFSTRTRYDIRHTEKMLIQVRQLKLSELHILKEFIDLSGQKKGYSTHDLSYYENFQKAFGDQMIALYAYLDIARYKQKYQDEISNAKDKLNRISEHQKGRKKSRAAEYEEIIAEGNKRLEEAEVLQKDYGNEVPLAASMFVLTPYEVLYLFSGSNSRLRKYKGSYLIQWKMISYAIEHQIPRYNFYGISGNFLKESKDYGVYEFKRGFNAEVIELIGSFTFIAHPAAYHIYQFLRRFKHILIHER